MRSFIVLSTLSFCLKVCVLVEGRYVVEVRLNGYTNPSGKCNGDNCFTDNRQHQFCCDSHDTDTCTGSERCDSYFVYCLRPLGTVDMGCPNNEMRAKSLSNEDDGPGIDFSQSKVLGLSNPQNFPGLGDAYEGIQLYIEVIDKDPKRDKPNEFVDYFAINHNLPVAESLQQNHGGMSLNRTVTMDLTITVLCAENFGGSNCTQCVPGFTGSDCNEIDHCSGVSCGDNGVCRNVVNSFRCMCSPGFTGVLCQTNVDIDDCIGVDCSENGRCVDGVNNFTCECAPGFRGPKCSEFEVKGSTSEAPGSDSASTVDNRDHTTESTGSYSSPGTQSAAGGTDGAQLRGAGNVTAIAGGVAGALLAFVILLILVIAIVIILKHYNYYNRKEVTTGNGNSGPLPGDNPVYEQVNTTSEIKGDSSLNTRTPVTATLPAEEEGTENGGEERNFDNFIYGDDDDDIDDGGHVYTAPFDQQDQQSLRDSHEFDNPIYGTNTSDS